MRRNDTGPSVVPDGELEVITDAQAEGIRESIARHAMNNFGIAKTLIPSMVKQAIRTKAWEHFTDGNGQKFDNVVLWLMAKPPSGVGLPLDNEGNIARGTVSIQELLDVFLKDRRDEGDFIREHLKAARDTGGGDRRSSNITVPRGTVVRTGSTHSRSALAVRLATEKPEHYQEFLDGKYRTITAAAEAAGLRSKTTNMQRAQSAIKMMTKPERKALLAWVQSEFDL